MTPRLLFLSHSQFVLPSYDNHVLLSQLQLFRMGKMGRESERSEREMKRTAFHSLLPYVRRRARDAGLSSQCMFDFVFAWIGSS